MSVRSLVQLERKDFYSQYTLLRSPCQKVEDFGDSFQQVVDDLVDTFMIHKIAVGLAAPQIGIPLRVAVINTKKSEAGPSLIIVNPVIISESGKKDRKKESCMSLPHYAGEVERRDKVSVAYQDRCEDAKTLDVTGYLARVIAHETDHLNGLLYIDRMDENAQLEPTDKFQYD